MSKMKFFTPKHDTTLDVWEYLWNDNDQYTNDDVRLIAKWVDEDDRQLEKQIKIYDSVNHLKGLRMETL